MFKKLRGICTPLANISSEGTLNALPSITIDDGVVCMCVSEKLNILT